VKISVTTIAEFDYAVEQLQAAYIQGKQINLEVVEKTRTSQQRKAIEVYCRILANGLNDAGKDMQTTLATAASIPWSQPRVKENIWKPIQFAMFKTNTTTKLKTGQVSEVYEVANRHMGENHGVSMPFPHYDGLIEG